MSDASAIYYIVKGSMNGDVLEDFDRRSLLQILQPFNGINPCSVVILDNVSIHHCEQIECMITGVGGNLVRFMPPYSPDYTYVMPLEEIFSQATALLKANDSAYVPCHYVSKDYGANGIQYYHTTALYQLHQACRLYTLITGRWYKYK